MLRLPRLLPALSLAAACIACQTKDVQSVNAANAAADSAKAAATTPAAAPPTTSPGAPAAADTQSVPAGPDAAVEYYTAAQLAHVGDSLARGSTTGHTLRAHSTFQYLQIRRTRSGVPEVHDRWTDVTVVQAGKGTLLSGGRVSGSRVESPGEHRGGVIAGGSSRPVGAGDLMIIPAGVPHQYLIAGGDSLRYLTVKVLAPSTAH